MPGRGRLRGGRLLPHRARHSQKYEAFVVNLKGFAWQSVQEVPGTQVLNKGMIAHVNAVSCPSACFCAAGGFYSDGHFGNTLPFTDDGAIA